MAARSNLGRIFGHSTLPCLNTNRLYVRLDGQTDVRIGCDGTWLPALHYDSASMPPIALQNSPILDYDGRALLAANEDNLSSAVGHAVLLLSSIFLPQRIQGRSITALRPAPRGTFSGVALELEQITLYSWVKTFRRRSSLANPALLKLVQVLDRFSALRCRRAWLKTLG